MQKKLLAISLGIAAIGAMAAPLEITDPRAANIEDIVKMPIKGIQAIQSKGQIYFLSENGRFVFTGQMVDIWQKKELNTITQIRDATERLNLTSLGLDVKSLNTMVLGNGKHQVTVYVDPLCSICHKLISDAKALTKEYTFNFIVVPAINDTSNVLAKKIFCAKDKSKTLNAFTTNTIKNLEQVSNCNISGYDKTLVSAQIMGVEGVPFVIAPNGRFAKGYPAKMAEWLAGNQK